MKCHQIILYGSKCLWFRVFLERAYHKQGDYRAHYVSRFRDLLRDVGVVEGFQTSVEQRVKWMVLVVQVVNSKIKIISVVT